MSTRPTSSYTPSSLRSSESSHTCTLEVAPAKMVSSADCVTHSVEHALTLDSLLGGGRRRFADYDNGRSIPVHVGQLLNKGWTITKKAVLFRAPQPPLSYFYESRHLFKALEATMSIRFGASYVPETNNPHHRFRKDLQHLESLCLWPYHTLEYTGANGSDAFREGNQAKLNLTTAQREMRVTCDLCGDKFGRSAEMKRHKQKHVAPQCACSAPGCDSQFYRMDRFRDHIRQAHQGTITITDDGTLQIDVPETAIPSTFLCVDCNEEFPTPGLLNVHVNRKHIKRYSCDRCSASFHLNADLLRHQPSHDPNRKRVITCPNVGCPRTFTRKDNMLRHKKLCM